MPARRTSAKRADASANAPAHIDELSPEEFTELSGMYDFLRSTMLTHFFENAYAPIDAMQRTVFDVRLRDAEISDTGEISNGW